MVGTPCSGEHRGADRVALVVVGVEQAGRLRPVTVAASRGRRPPAPSPRMTVAGAAPGSSLARATSSSRVSAAWSRVAARAAPGGWAMGLLASWVASDETLPIVRPS
jgi:hypothetical protein